MRFLTRHGYSGRRTPAELVTGLRAYADRRAHALEAEARRAIVLALVAALEPVVARITELTTSAHHNPRAAEI